MSVFGPLGSQQPYNPRLGQQAGSKLHLRNQDQVLDADFRPLFDSLNSNQNSNRVVQGVIIDDNESQQSSQQSTGASFSPYYQHISRANVQAQARQQAEARTANEVEPDPITQRVHHLERELLELKSMIGDNRAALDPNQSLPDRYTSHNKSYSSMLRGLNDIQNHIANA